MNGEKQDENAFWHQKQVLYCQNPPFPSFYSERFTSHAIIKVKYEMGAVSY
jgi:hypothetical protein